MSEVDGPIMDAAMAPALPARAEVEDFLFHEAALIDARDYDAWLALWEQDALYWVPCNDDDADPEIHIALIYDRYEGLCDRIARLQGGFALAQQPLSRCSHAITNVRVGGARGGLIEVQSILSLAAYRLGKVDLLAGRMVHRLRRKPDGLRLVEKRVYLINNDGPIGNLSFIL
ncbi:3-phenylpropionate/cinnamic acid dioxygenase, small subunit [Sphingobium faniae]|nr:3-phenylpropionate/cinnamic acid dioxygenase, small subunit [Sphingobium faniae]